MEEIFIINPKAGGDDPEVIASNVRKIYPDAEIVFTTAAGQIPELVSGHGGRRVFVVGGDGTFYEAANGAAAPVAAVAAGSGDSSEPATVCFIPAGSGNDFVRSLYKGKKFGEGYMSVLRASKNFTEKKIDCGKAEYNGETKFFLNIGSVGYDAEIVKNSERYKSKPIFQKISYILSVFYTLFRYKGTEMRVTVDGKVLEGKMLLTAVANGQYYGGGIRIAPKAELNDGLFDVLVIDMMSPLKTLFLLPRLIPGTHLKCRTVHLYHAKTVTVESPESFLLNLDGELMPTKKVTYTMCPDGMTALTPEK